jgi:hypothetical protein
MGENAYYDDENDDINVDIVILYRYYASTYDNDYAMKELIRMFKMDEQQIISVLLDEDQEIINEKPTQDYFEDLSTNELDALYKVLAHQQGSNPATPTMKRIEEIVLKRSYE